MRASIWGGPSCWPHIANWIGVKVCRRPRAHSPKPTMPPPTTEVYKTRANQITSSLIALHQT